MRESVRYSFHKRGNVWYAQEKIGDKYGTARSTGCKTREEAEKSVAGLSFGDFAKPFYGPKCPHCTRLKAEGVHFAENTCISGQRYVSRILQDKISSMQVHELTKNDVLEYRQRLIERRGITRSAQAEFAVFKTILRELAYREIKTIPMIPGIKYQQARRSVVPMKEIVKILKPELYSMRLHYEATLCVACTGMRAGEVRGLMWESVKDVIVIESNLPRETTIARGPKWGQVRICPYVPQLREVLEPRRGTGRVFPIAYKAWSKAVRSVSNNTITLHGIRHSLHTSLLEKAPRTLVRYMFGWTNDKTQDNYTHSELFSPSTLADAISKVWGQS